MGDYDFGHVKRRTQTLMDEAREGFQNPGWAAEAADDLRELLLKQADSLKEIRLKVEQHTGRRRPEISTIEVRAVEDDISDIVVKLRRHVLNHSGTIRASTYQHAQLPKLKMEPFRGDIYKFQQFWQMYEQNVHFNETVPKVTKFNYLISYLAGKARELVESIPVIEANYDIAVKKLKERYDDKQLLIGRHYRELQNISMAKNHAVGLRDTLDEIEKHLDCLKNLGQDVNQGIFPTIIMSKFPKHVVLEVEKTLAQSGYKDPPTEFLLEQLRLIVKAQVKVYVYTESGTGPKDVKYGKSEQHFSTTETLLVKESKLDHKIRCFYCTQKHWSDECTQFKTLDARKERAKEESRCFKCLGKHRGDRCQWDKECFHCKLRGKHHRSLCPELFDVSAMQLEEVSSEGEESEAVGMVAASEKVYMQTFNALMSKPEESPEQSLLVRGMFDSGSQRTYISESLSRRLRLKHLGKEILSVYVFGSVQPRRVTTFQVDVRLKLRNGSNVILRANEVPSIMGSFRNFTDLNDLKLPENLKLADVDRDKPVEILIGNDYYHDLVLDEKTRVQENLYLVNTKLGWVLSGRAKRQVANEGTEILSFMTISFTEQVTENNMVAWVEPERLPFSEMADNDRIKGLWEVDVLGIRESPGEIEDDLAVQSFNSSICQVGNRYQVSWPWKSFPPPALTSNYGLALGRLKSLLTRIQDKTILADYGKIFDEQLSKEVIEKVPNPFDRDDPNVIHYLPHHPVITPEKSTKVRIVFDGSAKAKKKERSLNECMYRGRVLLEDLVGILLRLRMHEYVVTSDIEKAFLQIGLHEHDRDVTRFLWVKDLNKPPTKENIEVYRFQRVAFGIIASPFLLNAVVKHHLARFNNEISTKISQNIYVDNVVVGCDTNQQAVELYEQGMGMFQEANMNLRCWVSNSPDLRKKVEDRTEEMKILGLNWHIREDCFTVKSKYKLDNRTPTKREIVSFVSSYFDPLGFFNPTLILAKIFIQELWDKNLGWGDTVGPEQKGVWEGIKPLLEDIPRVKVPRKIGMPTEKEVEIHCFTDASQKAYSAALYVRFEEEGKTVTRLLFSKARVAPKGTTIPRLELLGVLIGVRALGFVATALDVNVRRKYLWTDSKCVLYWIHRDKVQPLFVENRIKEIGKAKEVIFRYVPSDQNPADVLTRGRPACDLDQFWWEGPQWLAEREEFWPLVGEEFEVENSMLEQVEVLVAAPAGDSTPRGKELKSPFGIERQRFSTLTVLLRKTAYCYRYIQNLKRSANNVSLEVEGLTAAELEEARKLWCRKVQEEHFPNILKDTKPVVRALGLWLDEEGIVRCKGRVVRQDFTTDENFPILLPSQEYFTELVVRHHHVKLAHAGVSHTLAEIRKQYWLIQGRARVGQILARCGVCKRWGGGPYRLPEMPPLPVARISEALPFINTGLDYLGPLYTKMAGADNTKVWICLFTCLVTRAIHLELVLGSTAQEFLLALRRFMARRGTPKLVVSDNAAQFHLVAGVLSQAKRNLILETSVEQFLAEQGTEWHFITELAPWEGGVYERLVGLVKRALRRTIGRKKLDYSQLATATVEIEAILNSRPLTYVSEDINSNNVLTPAHFLNVRSCSLAIDARKAGGPLATVTRRELLSMWRRGQLLLDSFWQLWRGEYLQALRERPATHRQSRGLAAEDPKVGAVVQIGENAPRGTWRLAKIIELKTGRDGQVRTAKLLLPNRRVVARSLSQLYPLEMPFNP